MTEKINERLSGGVAQLSAASGADGPAVTPEIVPIGEGEVTEGQSGEKLYWPESTLREATQQGAFDDAKLLKGRPDVGHKDIRSQASPDEIAGGAGTFEYESGRGPVSSDGTVIDEHLGKLIDHGLVEISADFTDLEVGEYDPEHDARPVKSVGGVPYITILDRGASSGASISAGRAEQLGFNPDTESGDGDGEGENEDEGDEQTSDEGADTSTGSNEDTDSNMADQDKIEELHEQLAAVREEKAQVESERDSLKTEKESLEEKTENLESEVEEKESKLSEKEEKLDEMEDELDEAQSEAEFSRRQAALIAVGGNEAAAETLVDSDRSADDLAEMALDSEFGPEVLPSTEDEDTDEEQLSPMDRLNEQLAQSPAQRGQSPGDDDEEATPPDEEQLAAAEDRAFEVMDSSDVMTASSEDLSGREYLRQYKGVDPAQVGSVEQLRAKLNGEGGDA